MDCAIAALQVGQVRKFPFRPATVYLIFINCALQWPCFDGDAPPADRDDHTYVDHLYRGTSKNPITPPRAQHPHKQTEALI